MKIARLGITLIIFLAITLPACSSHHTVIPNPTIPHQTSRTIKVPVWLRKQDGTKQEVWCEFGAGHWILPPKAANPQ